jgi:DNA repair exonuclease SbcCD ATPase subunit
MKKIEFKKISAKNFMCFGDKNVEIEFKNYNNIVLVKGTNFDTAKTPEDAKASSNGAGKSSIPEILVYGLYGQTIKAPKKIGTKDVINQKTGKGLSVEVFWDDYKVERRRKPDSLRIWKGDEELTLGGMPATQELIENIIGLNYQTFVNVVVFTDDNSQSFLECNAAEKRNIIENLLSLEKYKTYHENAKALVKQHSVSIKTIQQEISHYENLIKNEESTKINLSNNVKKWNTDKISEINSLGRQKETAQEDIKKLKASFDMVEYESAQNEISELQNVITTLESKIEPINKKISNFEKIVSEISAEIKASEEAKHSLNLEKNTFISEIKKVSEVINKLNNLEPGIQCSHCYGEIKTENYETIKKEHQKLGFDIKSKYDSVISEIKIKDEYISSKNENINVYKKDLDISKKLLTDINNKISIARNKITSLSKIKAPDNNLKIAGLAEKIKIIDEQITKAQNQLNGVTPYDDMIVQNEIKLENYGIDLKDKISNYEEIKKQEKYLEFWKIAFGDSGIRKFVLDEIIPALNENLNYWLQFLIDGKLQILFDNTLEEKIFKFPNDDKPLVYHILSNGQRRRINLALNQAFAHIMSLNTGKSPGLVFLDEVSSNIDAVGIESIYAMICELSKEKMVFVTTHDENLLEMLNGCSEIQLQMKNGITNLV